MSLERRQPYMPSQREGYSVPIIPRDCVDLMGDKCASGIIPHVIGENGQQAIAVNDTDGQTVLYPDHMIDVFSPKKHRENKELPKAPQWSKDLARDPELRTALIDEAFDTLEPCWMPKLPENPSELKAYYDKVQATYDSFKLPASYPKMDGTLLNDLTFKELHYRTISLFQSAAVYNPDFDNILFRAQNGVLAIEDLQPTPMIPRSMEPTVLDTHGGSFFDIAAGDH